MMNPELKQDLDDLFTSTNEAVKELHAYHGVPMGVMTFDIDYDLEPCEGCTCGLADDGFDETAAPAIETLDDFDTAVSAIVEAFEEAIGDAKDDLMENLERLAEDVEEANLDETIMSIVVASRFQAASARLEEAFQV